MNNQTIYQNRKPLVYICSPYAGKIVMNCSMARLYCKFAADHGYIPYASHLFFTQFLNDDNPEDRKLGLELGLQMLEHCDEVWVLGDKITSGMQQEYDHAKTLGIKTRRFPHGLIDLMDGGDSDGSI